MRGVQRGVALLVVLWACTLLAIVVGGLATVSRTEALQTRYSLGQQRARYAAEAGVMRAIAVIDARRRLVVQPSESVPTGLPGDGRSVAFSFDKLQVAVGVLDESGKVDLNAADEPVLRALFTAAGCDAERAQTVASNVMEWRRPASEGDDGGRSRYAAAGLGYGPRHAPFVAIEELQSVLGVDPALYAAVEPAITVWSGRGQPQAGFAPALAMAALPGMDLTQARRLVALRDSQPIGAQFSGLPAGIDLDATQPGNTFTFRASADDGHGMKAQVEATVRFTRHGPVRNPSLPVYTILRWRDGPAA